MSVAFVVMWRAGPGAKWQVQPHVHDKTNAAIVAGGLVNAFHGEAWAVPVELPSDDEVTRDLGKAP